jgi:hypothetical protein
MIELARLERAVLRRESDRIPLLLDALAALEGGRLFAGVEEADGYTRLAAAVATAIADPELKLEADQVRLLMTNAGSLNALFAASAFGDSAFALAAVRPSFDGRISTLPPGEQAAYLALDTLDTPGALDLEDTFALTPESALVRALTFVQTPPLTPLGAARREAVLAQAERLAAGHLPPTLVHVALASAAWMICSYGARPDRHHLKPVLNGVFRKLLSDIGLKGPQPPWVRPRPERPTMVVIAEVIHAQHVQFRYFGQYLRQLATRFRLVLVTPKRELGPEVEALFDETFAFDPYGDAGFLQAVTAFVTAAAPDVVFWPSVGMARWGPFLANLRLAPIQLTALGHSASTFIPEMDYYLTEEGYVSDPALFSEKLLLLPDRSLRFERPPGYVPLPPQVRPAASPLRIAVPSNVLKLNPGFLLALQRVRKAAPRPVEFHLFPNARPVQAAALRAKSPLTGAVVVHPRMAAPQYLAALNACDLVLSPFPFGGLHSTVDALRQGLPVVAMEGAEPHARTDAMILRRLGMPEWLIAADEAAYLAAALRLIGDDALRVELSQQALAARIDEELFGDASTELGSEVVDAVWAAYRGHETLKASPRRAWPLDDLLALEGRG